MSESRPQDLSEFELRLQQRRRLEAAHARAGQRKLGVPLLIGGLGVLLLIVAVMRFNASGPEVPDGPDVTAHGPHSYMLLHHGQPVTWSSCRDIEFVVNPAGGPSDGVEEVQQAAAVVSALTGLRMHYGGTTEIVPANGHDMVVVGWRSRSMDSRLATSSGYGGASAARTEGRPTFTSGSITLSSEFFASASQEQRLATLMHEWGHVVGLGHVDAAGELMQPSLVDTFAFGPGDREGLARLGSGPCV